MNPALGEQGEDNAQLLIADQRLAANDGDVQGALAIDDFHESIDELLAFEVPEPAQGDAAAEMIVAVRVAAGTPQRALSRDLDRKYRLMSAEDASPRGKNPFHRLTIA